MENNKAYDKTTAKIINSKSFGHSNTYANLLLFLVASTLEEDIPKETTIASEILGKPNFDPSQSTLVRVYIYNLRKKLAKYYSKEGKEDKIIVQIPKGSYEVRFVEKKILAPKKSYSWSKGITLTLLLLFTISLAYNISLYPGKHNTNPINENGLWKDLFMDQKPLMVLLGDLFIYQEDNPKTGTQKIIRDPFINSLEDYDKFILEQSETNIIYEPLSYSLLIYNSALWIKDLSEIFSHNQKDFTIRNMVRFNPKELPDNNFIVIGMMKTFGLFKDYLAGPSLYYNNQDQSIVYRNEQNGSETVYRPYGDPNGHHTDYGFITKAPGPNNNNIYLFGGIWDTAASQSLKYFTSPKLLKELESALIEKYGSLPKYYQIVLEVKGVDRMELSSKIILMEEIVP
ncbi:MULTISPECIES: hypothetical protein [Arenibacter]|uniref:hypothetical protein n=1 Tax=Arenibacter TaxID=178469 RepID=UPI0004DF4EC7|nr:MULTISPECIES: hypothetical protein [Arenibacter]GBF21790.1 hypothetical protein C21_03978 [Arenibacter sp. NBRC 103722]